MDCEYCNKSFDSKNKLCAHQKTKKCQQFRTITFICRSCSTAILGYDNILSHIESCSDNKPILHSEILKKINTFEHKKNIFGKGLNGKTSYIYNYEKCILTCGAPQIISELIVTSIDNMVDKANLKTLNEILASYSKDAILKEISFEYPQPYTISDIGKFLEYETRTVMAFILSTNYIDLFQILLRNCKIFPVTITENEVYIADKIIRENNIWNIEWKKNSPKEVALSMKGLFLPALKYAVRLFVNEGSNSITQKLLELIQDLNDPAKISILLNILSKKNINNFNDVNNIMIDSKFIFEGAHKHTPMDTFIKNISFEINDNKNKKLQSLLISVTKENERDALFKKLNISSEEN